MSTVNPTVADDVEAATSFRGAKILLVDDEVSVLRALRRLLRREGYELHLAGNGEEALEILQREDIAVLVCDQRMPGMSGAEVLARSAEIRPSTRRVILTGYSEISSLQTSVNEGRVSQFLTKPWDDDHLKQVVVDLLRSYYHEQHVTELNGLVRQQRDELRVLTGKLESKVRERTRDLQEAYTETLSALVLALDAREAETAGHSRRVACYCLYLAMLVGVSEDDLEHLYRGALLHDIGKIGIPDSILLKPGKLEPAEREAMKRHVAIGGRLIQGISYLSPAVSIPLFHHERWDGTGYMEGRKGRDIPIAARCFAVVDVYDALCSERPYKAAMSHEAALEVVQEASGSHLDPAIVAAFLEVSELTWTKIARAAYQYRSYDAVLAECRGLLPEPPHGA